MALSTIGRNQLNTGIDDNSDATAMTINSSENIGIGTSTITNTSNYRNIHVEGTNGTIMRFMANGTQVGQIQSDTNEFQLNAITNDPMVFKTNNTEAMRISSSNVGIGTNSPSVRLDTRLGTTTGKVAEFHNSVGYGIGFTVESDGGVNTINAETNQALAFATNGASNERMRIDASGNVLVGKTANNNTTAGGSIRAGESSFVADGSRTVLFNRLSSDGDIVEFRKDGTTVGSIGTNGGRPFFKNSTYGGLKVGTGYSVDPANNSTGAGWDNALDLGAGGTRWKDLYLSGGAYLGGTGSANKLDDYEIGSISSISGGGLSYTLNAGNYVKVGDLVHFEIDFQFPSTSNTNTAEVSVLPFTFQSNFGSGSIGYHTRSGDTTTYISGGTTNVRFASNAGSNFRNVDMSGVRIIAAYTYRAS